MTKKHFIDAAEIVRNILNGEWTPEFPDWADSSRNMTHLDCGDEDSKAEQSDDAYTRAVQTAEAFVMLFTQHNARFDTQRFLIACGLADKPTKAKR